MTFLGNRKRAFDSRHTTTLNYTPTPTPTQTKRAGVEPPAPLTFYATIPVSPRLLAYGGRNRLRLGQPVVVYGRGPRLLGPDLPVDVFGLQLLAVDGQQRRIPKSALQLTNI